MNCSECLEYFFRLLIPEIDTPETRQVVYYPHIPVKEIRINNVAITIMGDTPRNEHIVSMKNINE